MSRYGEKLAHTRIAIGYECKFAACPLGDNDILQRSAVLSEQLGDGDKKADRNKNRQSRSDNGRANVVPVEDGFSVHSDLLAVAFG